MYNLYACLMNQLKIFERGESELLYTATFFSVKLQLHYAILKVYLKIDFKENKLN